MPPSDFSDIRRQYRKGTTNDRAIIFQIGIDGLIPAQRITIPEIENHPWFLKNLPVEDVAEEKCGGPAQSEEAILSLIQEARKPAEGRLMNGGGTILDGGSMELDEDDELDDFDASGDLLSYL